MQIPTAQISVKSSRESLREKTVQAIMAAQGRGDPTPNIKVGKLTDGLYPLIFGEHRLEAFKRLGKTHIEADVVDRPLTDAEVAVERFRENHDRSDFSPREQANLILTIMRGEGIDQAAIAERLKISPTKVAKLLKVFKRLAADLQEAQEAGKLGFAEAYELSALDDHNKQRELAALCIKGVLGREGLKKKLKVELGERVRKSKPQKFDVEGVSLTVDGDMDAQTLIEKLKELIRRFRKGDKIDDEDGPLFLGVSA